MNNDSHINKPTSKVRTKLSLLLNVLSVLLGLVLCALGAVAYIMSGYPGGGISQDETVWFLTGLGVFFVLLGIVSSLNLLRKSVLKKDD